MPQEDWLWGFAAGYHKNLLVLYRLNGKINVIDEFQPDVLIEQTAEMPEEFIIVFEPIDVNPQNFTIIGHPHHERSTIRIQKGGNRFQSSQFDFFAGFVRFEIPA